MDFTSEYGMIATNAVNGDWEFRLNYDKRNDLY
jgi:hypothetical protein